MVVAASHPAGHPINTRPAIMAAILVMGVIYNLLWPNDIVHSVIERDIPGLPTGSSPQHTRRCTRFSTELSSVLSPGFPQPVHRVVNRLSRHCGEQSDEQFCLVPSEAGLLRFARNDDLKTTCVRLIEN